MRDRRAYNAAWYAAHREERRAYNAAWYAAHREEKAAYNAAYRCTTAGILAEERAYQKRVRGSAA